MQIIWMIVVGLIVGALARTLMPGAQPMGWIMTALLGIGGSLLGGLLGSVLFKSRGRQLPPGRLGDVDRRRADPALVRAAVLVATLREFVDPARCSTAAPCRSDLRIRASTLAACSFDI
jgi:uncharacterized membrane protein YeaQ/YmgE (transglycosylase-associated protein family)